MTECAAILAGGLGTRLRPVVNDRPKVMAMVAGRPFITYLLDQLAEAGMRRVVLCTGYLEEIIRDELGDTYRGMELVYSVEKIPLGTGGALRHALDEMQGDTILVMNGDSWCGCDLTGFSAVVAANGSTAGMALVRVEDVSRFGAVKTNSASRIEEFIEKGARSGPGWINAGIYLLPLRLICEMPLHVPISLEREIFQSLVTSGLFGFPCQGPFIDIGIPEEYRRAQTFFSEALRGTS